MPKTFFMSSQPSLRNLLKCALVLITLTLFSASCGRPQKGKESADFAKRMYIDSNLLFALAVPEQWQKGDEFPLPASHEENVIWVSSERGPTGEPKVMFRVTSQPPGKAKGGFERLRADFLQAQPLFQEQSSQERVVNRYPAMQMIGQFADRTLLVVFVTSSQRSYLLEFLTLSSEFDNDLPQFEVIMNSFQVL